MIGRTATAAQMAADQYRVRQARAQAMVRTAGMPRGDAERHLRPWLALACILGAALPEIDALLADLHATDGVGPHMMAPGELRWLAAEEICPRSIWAPMLARARDQAFGRCAGAADEATLASAISLHCICVALQHDVNGPDIPPYMPPAPCDARNAA